MPVLDPGYGPTRSASSLRPDILASDVSKNAANASMTTGQCAADRRMILENVRARLLEGVFLPVDCNLAG
jgi:hypothetical protein